MIWRQKKQLKEKWKYFLRIKDSFSSSVRFYLWFQHEQYDLRHRKLKSMHNAQWILETENMVISCVCIHSYIDFACHFNRNFGILYACIDLQQLETHAPAKMKRLILIELHECVLCIDSKIKIEPEQQDCCLVFILIVFQFYKSIN